MILTFILIFVISAVLVYGPILLTGLMERRARNEKRAENNSNN